MADEITQALTNFRKRAESYRLYHDYYCGRHRLAFATEKFRNAFGTLFRSFADNLCPVVVDTIADRLKVVGFGVEEGAEVTAETAWSVWQVNRMDRRAGELHLEVLRSGDAYLVVWPDAVGRPIFYVNVGAVMTVNYDPEQPGLVQWAAKLWRLDDGKLRLNLYFPDRIEKYVTRAKADSVPEKDSAFVPYEVEDEPWPLPNPWEQVPVFHFANNAGVGDMGVSELANVIPLQDALNKAVADMLVAMEYVALPQRWATGLEVDIDEVTGKPRVPFTPGVERVWAVGDPEVRFGQFDPANLQQFLAVQDGFRLEIARVSGIPVHYLMPERGDWPSGEALKQAEARLTAKLSDRQVAFGNVYEDALSLALRMVGQGGEARLSTLWQDPSPRSDREMAEVALIKQQIGVSREQILSELGYSPEQIERMTQERESASAQLGQALLAGFDRGE